MEKRFYTWLGIILGILAITGTIAGFAVSGNNVKRDVEALQIVDENQDKQIDKNTQDIEDSDIKVITLKVIEIEKDVEEIKEDSKRHQRKTEEKFDKIIEEIQKVKESRF